MCILRSEDLKRNPKRLHPAGINKNYAGQKTMGIHKRSSRNSTGSPIYGRCFGWVFGIAVRLPVYGLRAFRTSPGGSLPIEIPFGSQGRPPTQTQTPTPNT
eukprot:8437092-Pyramimonas_sp.AAC.1